VQIHLTTVYWGATMDMYDEINTSITYASKGRDAFGHSTENAMPKVVVAYLLRNEKVIKSGAHDISAVAYMMALFVVGYPLDK
jgi:hypothetical protein